MAIRGIDAQIMVTRSTEVAKDASRMVRAHDNNQDQIAENERAMNARRQNRVAKAEKAGAKTIRREYDDQNRQEYEAPPKKEKTLREKVDELVEEEERRTATYTAEGKKSDEGPHIDIKI